MNNVVGSGNDDAPPHPLATVRDVLSEAQRRLQGAGCPSPGPDSMEMLCHVLGTSRSHLNMSDRLTVVDRVRFERLLMRRVARVPLQHILGTAAFRHLIVRVGPGVFVPRPETEVVGQAAIDALREWPQDERIAVDLCSGTGILALSLATEVSGVVAHAVEVDPIAASWTRLNIEDYRETCMSNSSTVELHVADAGTCADPGATLAHLGGRVAVVVANPPYIPEGALPRDPEVRDHDPSLALFGGPDGLREVRRIVVAAAILLRPGGRLVIEHGDEQGDFEKGVPAVIMGHVADHEMSLLTATPEGQPLWRDVSDHRDLTRRPRYTIAVRA